MTEKIKWPKRYSKPRIYAVKMDPEQAVLSCCSQSPGTIGAKMFWTIVCYGLNAGTATDNFCGYNASTVATVNNEATPS